MEFVDRKAGRVHGFGMIFEWTPENFTYRGITN